MEMHERAMMTHAQLQVVPQGNLYQFQHVEPMIITDPMPARPRDLSPEPGQSRARLQTQSYPEAACR